MLQIIHRLQSRHCQRIVLIFSTSLSEYCKHDGCPTKRKRLGFYSKRKWFVTAISTFSTIDHIFRDSFCIFIFIPQTETTYTHGFNNFLKDMINSKIRKCVKNILFSHESLLMFVVWWKDLSTMMNVDHASLWLPLFYFRSDHRNKQKDLIDFLQWTKKQSSNMTNGEEWWMMTHRLNTIMHFAYEISNEN